MRTKNKRRNDIEWTLTIGNGMQQLLYHTETHTYTNIQWVCRICTNCECSVNVKDRRGGRQTWSTTSATSRDISRLPLHVLSSDKQLRSATLNNSNILYTRLICQVLERWVEPTTDVKFLLQCLQGHHRLLQWTVAAAAAARRWRSLYNG